MLRDLLKGLGVFCFIGLGFVYGQAEEYLLRLEVLSEETGLPLENAQIYITPCECGGVTNSNGDLAMMLPAGDYQISTIYIGFKTDIKNISLTENTVLKINLSEENEQLSEVVVEAKRLVETLETPQMGVLQVTSKEIKKIPVALGEMDVLRSITLLPGVNNAGEISNGISVRGGSLDQNLILYDYAPVYNPTHLFGLFSVFTPDVVSTVDLYRANIPARYGGRTTSVLDVKVKTPYVDKLKLSGGIGLVSSRLAIETPIIRDKLMVNAAGRIGFTDFLLPIVSKRLKDTKANFYDATVKLLYLPTRNDQISFTGFISKDFYQLDLITQVENINASSNQYDFRTLNGTLNWTHSFKNDFNLRTLLISTNYTPKTLFPEVDSSNKITFSSQIKYLSFISELSKRVDDKLDYYGGVQINRYTIDPGLLDPGSGNSINPVDLEDETSYEFSGFGNINYNPWEKFFLSAGLRLNHFVFVGPYTQATFDENSGAVIDTKVFGKGDAVKTYNSLEPRLGATYLLGDKTSIKGSYARLTQFLQNIYNSTTPLPTSRWKTSDPNIKPQTSDAFGLGLYHNFNEGAIEMSIEGYYRISENNLTYKPGADFFLEEFIERDVVQGEGKAYGVEIGFRKPKGRINGWFNYTLSRSLLRSNNEKLADRVNNNQWYPSDFDRPHVFNSTVNFEGNKNHIVSLNFTAQSGRPYTVANNVFPLEGINIPIFLERNNARLRTYHRLDFSWTIKYHERQTSRWLGDWTFTIYNVYARRNPFNLYYGQRNGGEDGDVFGDSPLGSYELSVLNSPLFSVTYNFVFQ